MSKLSKQKMFGKDYIAIQSIIFNFLISLNMKLLTLIIIVVFLMEIVDTTRVRVQHDIAS